MTIAATARITYQSPDSRVVVERFAAGEFYLYCDGEFQGSHRTAQDAELMGLAWLTEQAAPRCELCNEPAVLVGEQWVCRECSPVYEDLHCEGCGCTVEAEDCDLYGDEMLCSKCIARKQSPLARWREIGAAETARIARALEVK